MKKKTSINIGTSGWNYKHWKGNFYPEGIPQKKWLEYYITKFSTVELNNTFYRLPLVSTFKKWHDSTPENFLFSVKASRFITHIKRLNEPEEPVDKFISSAKNLKTKLGPVLFQLPPGFKYDPERLECLLKILPPKLRYTFEFRNSTWWNDETYQLLRRYNSAFCIFELGEIISTKEVTADFVYIRLHGPSGRYSGDYDKHTIKEWADLFNQWKKEDKDIFCYFDNDERGFAAKNALDLKEMVG